MLKPLPTSLPGLARLVLNEARANGLTIATAESCTGGLVGAALTGIPGSSDVVERGFITYSNRAKAEMLSVPTGLIEMHGAVSAEVAGAMAEGALWKSGAGLSVAITGVAGPGGGSEVKPVGLVHFAGASRNGQVARVEKRFDPALGREGIRKAATREALLILLDLAQRHSREGAFV